MRVSAITFTAPGVAELQEEDMVPPGPGQLTVRSRLTLVSTGTEMVCLRGECDEGTHWHTFMRFPHRPGYTAVGTVHEVGEGVTAWQPGDRICTASQHRSYANVDVDRVWGTRVPESLSDEDAVWAVLAVITQTGVRQAEHVMGDTVVVIGLGPLGQLVTRYMRALGMMKILVVDPVQGRIDRALDHGATDGFCGPVENAREFVLEHTGGVLADVVYDVTGHWSVLPLALPLARDHGKLLLLGDSPFPTRQHLTYDVVSRQVQIIGSRSSWLPPKYASWTPQRQVDLFFEYLTRGQMSVADLLTHTYHPEQAGEAYRLLYENRMETLGVAFDWR